MVKISVIIPVLNGAAFIGRAIDSVIQQTYPAHEMIVIDNGSTDDTAIIAQNYPQVKLLSHLPPGVSGARNLGARCATGDWLAFLDADDWYYPNRLAHHAAWIESDPELELLTGNFEYVDAASGSKRDNFTYLPLGRALKSSADSDHRCYIQPEQLASLVARHIGDTHTLTVNRRLFMQVGGYPRGYAVCEDVHLLVRLLATAAKTGAITEPLAAYYVHAQSVTRREPLAAQQQTVAALNNLHAQSSSFPAPIRQGLTESLRLARLDFSYALLKRKQKRQAVIQQLRGLMQNPKAKQLRDFGSILFG